MFIYRLLFSISFSCHVLVFQDLNSPYMQTNEKKSNLRTKVLKQGDWINVMVKDVAVHVTKVDQKKMCKWKSSDLTLSKSFIYWCNVSDNSFSIYILFFYLWNLVIFIMIAYLNILRQLQIISAFKFDVFVRWFLPLLKNVGVLSRAKVSPNNTNPYIIF